MALRVVAHLAALPGKVDALKSVLEGLVAPTHQEIGCISYELLQSTEDPARFTFVEEWASEDAFQAHFETEHIRGALVRLPELLAAELDLRTYRLVC